MTVTYAKTKAGEWVARGPVALIIEGQVTVTKRDGSSKTETIVRTGKAWTQDGEQVRYGYLAPTSTTTTSSVRHATPERRLAGQTRASGLRACADCGGPIQTWSDSPDFCHDCC